MDEKSLTKLTPWQDRWSEPNVRQLINSVPGAYRRAFEHLLKSIEQIDGANCEITWYGPAWKWTIKVTDTANVSTTDAASKAMPATPDASTLCYLVPSTEAPLVCVPLDTKVIDSLPMSKLSKFIRDGIKVAKCAVTIHWATWTAATQTEAGQILDLIERRRCVNAGQEQPDTAKRKRR